MISLTGNECEVTGVLTVLRLAQEKVVAAPKTGGRKISMKEVEQHASKESAWFVRDGKASSKPPPVL